MSRSHCFNRYCFREYAANSMFSLYNNKYDCCCEFISPVSLLCLALRGNFASIRVYFVCVHVFMYALTHVHTQHKVLLVILDSSGVLLARDQILCRVCMSIRNIYSNCLFRFWHGFSHARHVVSYVHYVCLFITVFSLRVVSDFNYSTVLYSE